MSWSIVCKPEGKYVPRKSEDEDDRAMVVLLVRGPRQEEISRVGWVRHNTKHPQRSFDKQLDKEIEKARKSRDLLNELCDDSGVLL